MKSLIYSEWERIWGRKKTVGCFLSYLISMGLITWVMHRSLLFSGGVAFYGFGMDHPDNETPLNALNFSTFLLKDVSIFLVVVILPMLVADSLNGEYTTGALRLVLIRPHSRRQLLIAKWISQAFMLFLFLAVTFVYGTVAGWLIFPQVSETVYYQIDQPLSILGAYGYNLVFYAFTFAVWLAILGLGSLLSSLMPNSILAFLSTVGVLIGVMYLSDHFSFLIYSGPDLFRIMSGPGMGLFVLKVVVTLLISTLLTLIYWNQRDWML